MTIAFLVITAISFVAMKAASLLVERSRPVHLVQFLACLAPSTVTWRKRRPAAPADVARLLFASVVDSAISVTLVVVYTLLE